MDMTPQAWPDWYDGRHINEVLFCQQFLEKHPMKCVRGRLFTVDGLIEDEGQIGNLILEEISGVLTSGLSKGVPWLLPAADYQGAEHAHVDRQGRRGQKPHRTCHALTVGRQHEYHQHPEGGEQPVQPCGLGKQAPDGGR